MTANKDLLKQVLQFHSVKGILKIKCPRLLIHKYVSGQYHATQLQNGSQVATSLPNSKISVFVNGDDDTYLLEAGASSTAMSAMVEQTDILASDGVVVRKYVPAYVRKYPFVSIAFFYSSYI